MKTVRRRKTKQMVTILHRAGGATEDGQTTRPMLQQKSRRGWNSALLAQDRQDFPTLQNPLARAEDMLPDSICLSTGVGELQMQSEISELMIGSILEESRLKKLRPFESRQRNYRYQQFPEAVVHRVRKFKFHLRNRTRVPGLRLRFALTTRVTLAEETRLRNQSPEGKGGGEGDEWARGEGRTGNCNQRGDKRVILANGRRSTVRSGAPWETLKTADTRTAELIQELRDSRNQDGRGPQRLGFRASETNPNYLGPMMLEIGACCTGATNHEPFLPMALAEVSETRPSACRPVLARASRTLEE